MKNPRSILYILLARLLQGFRRVHFNLAEIFAFIPHRAPSLSKTHTLTPKNADALDQVVTQCQRYIKDGHIVLALSNNDYREIALNWALMIKKCNIQNYAIIALDKQTRDFLAEKQLNVIHLPLPQENKHFVDVISWKKHLLHKLIKNNISVVFSDVDAIWLRNPLPDFIFSDTSSNLIVSIEEFSCAFPNTTRKFWGFTVCSGWFFLRSSAETLRFMDIWQQYTRGDQLALNMTLLHQACKARQKWIKQKDGSRLLQLPQFQVRLLSSDVVWRDGDIPAGKTYNTAYPDNPYVIHPLKTAKKGDACIHTLKNKGLWHAIPPPPLSIKYAYAEKQGACGMSLPNNLCKQAIL